MLPTSAADSGGFFVAVIKRLRGGVPLAKHTPEPESEPAAEPDSEPEAGGGLFGCCSTEDNAGAEAPAFGCCTADNGSGAPVQDVRAGDWTCPRCGANVFKSKRSCFSCKTPRPYDAVAVAAAAAAGEAAASKGTEGLYPLLVRFAEPVDVSCKPDTTVFTHQYTSLPPKFS